MQRRSCTPALSTSLSLRAEYHHLVHYNLAVVFFNPLLILVWTVDQLSFPRYFLSFLQVFLRIFGCFPPCNEVVPLGFGHFITLGAFVRFIRGKRDACELLAAFQV